MKQIYIQHEKKKKKKFSLVGEKIVVVACLCGFF